MNTPVKIGILGGGQLGRMLLQVAADYPAEMYVMEKTEDCPCASLCRNLVVGDIKKYEDVIRFGSEMDVLTIEIEHVNTDALRKLKEMGKTIFPDPEVLHIIQDKGLQKQFYAQHGIPSAPFLLTENKQDTSLKANFLPAAHKLRRDGYDGKGVCILRTESDLPSAFDAPSVLEKMIDIKKELAVIVACSTSGEMAVYPVCEMVFHAAYNLVDYLITPADIPAEIAAKASQIAVQAVEAFHSPGLYAVELFMDQQDEIWVNEIAPRAHNSGHATIEGNYCSQYEMQMRLFLGLPLGNPEMIMPSLMYNLIGSTGNKGAACYKGTDEIYSLGNAYIHLYGKTVTAPGRKMGHVTLIHPDREELIDLYEKAKDRIQIVAS